MGMAFHEDHPRDRELLSVARVGRGRFHITIVAQTVTGVQEQGSAPEMRRAV
jgi:hypothetical protein